MQHLTRPNLALLTMRRIRTSEYFHFFVAESIVGKDAVSITDSCVVFPLYTYITPEQTAGTLFAAHENTRQPNLAPTFIEAIKKKLDIAFIYDTIPQDIQIPLTIRNWSTFTPEQVICYAYAIFHSPNYRSRYEEFLKIDFPRLPLTSNIDLFHKLIRLGGKLIKLHLVEFILEDQTDVSSNWPRYPRLAQFIGGNQVVERFPSASNAWHEGRVAINRSSGFTGIPEDVWNFYIGGHQVCHKWLKDRKGRTLSDADIHHYCKIVTALYQTIRLMAEIDEIIEEHGGWPIE